MNWQDYDARFYDRSLGRWHVNDPLSEDYHMFSPYHFSGNNPVIYVDPNGESYYYFGNGTFQAETDDDKDDVYYWKKTGTTTVTIDGVDFKANVKEAIQLKDKKGKAISHDSFVNSAATVYGESSAGYGIDNKYEMFAIASAHQRNDIAYGENNNTANRFRNTEAKDRSGGMAMANSAVINALTGGIDYSKGADQWDGAEQAMVPRRNMNLASNGRFQYKMNTMGWRMSNSHYRSWMASVNGRFGANRFTVPQSKVATHNYGGMRNKGKKRIRSTAQYGLTMFWKTSAN